MQRYKTFMLLVSALFLYSLAGCESTKKVQSTQAEQKVNRSIRTPAEGDYIKLIRLPSLIGSRSEFLRHVKYPKSCYQAKVEGTIIIQFVVTKTGAITDFKVHQGIGSGCDEAVIQALKQHAEFTVGMQLMPETHNLKPVDVRMRFPIEFNLH